MVGFVFNFYEITGLHISIITPNIPLLIQEIYIDQVYHQSSDSYWNITNSNNDGNCSFYSWDFTEFSYTVIKLKCQQKNEPKK